MNNDDDNDVNRRKKKPLAADYLTPLRLHFRSLSGPTIKYCQNTTSLLWSMGYVCVCACVEHGREYIWYGTLFHLCTVYHSYYVDHQATLYFKVLSVAISSSLHFLFSAHTINNSSSNLVFKREICFLSCSVFILFFRFFFSFQERRRRRRRKKCPPFHFSKSLKSIVTPFLFSSPPYGEQTHIQQQWLLSCCCCCHSISFLSVQSS